MQRTPSATRGRTAILIAVLGLVLATAGTITAIIARPASSAHSLERNGVPGPDPARSSITRDLDSPTPEAPAFASADGDGRVTGDDGLLPAGATVFDDGYAGIAGLRPELLEALRTAAVDAADHGVEFVVNSGWRSAEYQQLLLREAVSDYGSLDEAARWVATPQTSAHVSGDAVDIDGAEAAAWLSAYGAAYGLCQTYGNEPWHYELIPQAAASGCPGMYADPTEDPRMQG